MGKGKLNTILHGADAIIGFLGPTMQPVTKEVAQLRADICADCLLNKSADGWTEKVSMHVARATRQYFRIKRKLNLTVEEEERIGICEACCCPIKLKIWMPIDYIRDHTSEEVMADFVTSCWIVNE